MGTSFWAAAGAVLALSLSSGMVQAQHEPRHPTPPDTSAPADSMKQLPMSEGAMMTGVLDIPLTRMGSGTSWLPDAAPMHAVHFKAGPWALMVHGVVFGMYDKQFGRRGDDQVNSVNWGMLMATRSVGPGSLQLRGMLSAEPFTVGAKGYPLLLQSGESYKGLPLHDRQHPHDLFMELAALYERPIARNLALSLYVAPVGEPAVGPVAFPHRPSAASDPLAPLAHHWQDATHISFGVLTAGLFTHRVKVEGSLFNGREPDENRWNFEHGPLDSASGRIKIHFPSGWSGQVSFASRRNPEGLFPGNIHRTTASLHYGAAGDRPLAVSLIWGRDNDEHHGAPSTLPGLGVIPLAVLHPNAPRGYTDYWLLEGAYQATPWDQMSIRRGRSICARPM